MIDPSPHLTTRALARTVELHDSADSTNELAKARARAGAPHGLVVVARAQTGGRGRLGRTWDSPLDAGVYASFVVRPTALSLRSAPLLTLAAGVAVQAATARVAGLDGGLKWPNDLWVARGPLMGRKVAGILVETSAMQDRIEHAIIGVGINVREVPRPPGLELIATSLEAATGRSCAVAEVLAALAGALEETLELLELGGAPPILDRWRRVALGVGAAVRIGALAGVMEGVADDGALCVRTDDGVVRRAYVGDLELSLTSDR